MTLAFSTAVAAPRSGDIAANLRSAGPQLAHSAAAAVAELPALIVAALIGALDQSTHSNDKARMYLSGTGGLFVMAVALNRLWVARGHPSG
jgi:hypothetical protein